MRGKIKYIENKVANDFLLPKHYSGRKPQITVAFGWYVDNILSAVCTFGKPASNTLCDGICGKEYSKDVYELNRLCRVNDFNEQLSQFVSQFYNIITDTVAHCSTTSSYKFVDIESKNSTPFFLNDFIRKLFN